MSGYDPVILEAARDVMAEIEAKRAQTQDLKGLRVALAQMVEEVAHELGVSKRTVWRGLRGILEERGYRFGYVSDVGADEWREQARAKLDAIGDRLVRKGIVVKSVDPLLGSMWSINMKLPPAEMLQRRSGLKANERHFFETLIRLRSTVTRAS